MKGDATEKNRRSVDIYVGVVRNNEDDVVVVNAGLSVLCEMQNNTRKGEGMLSRTIPEAGLVSTGEQAVDLKILKGNLQEADPEERRVDPVLSWMNFAEGKRETRAGFQK